MLPLPYPFQCFSFCCFVSQIDLCFALSPPHPLPSFFFSLLPLSLPSSLSIIILLPFLFSLPFFSLSSSLLPSLSLPPLSCPSHLFIFSPSLLVEELSLVWRMSDMDADGKLSLPEFLCAMTLVARRRQGIALPTSPPKELLTSLLVETGTRADTQFRTTSSSTVPTPAFTPRESPPVSSAAVSAVAPDAAPTIRWKPSAEELVRYRALFGSLDTAKSGYVSQAQAQPLMSSSGLPPHELAHIWKISDVDQDSRLTVSEFLCVLAISAKRRSGASLPETLPAELQELVGPPPQQKPAIKHDIHAQWMVSSAELDMYRTIFTNIDSAGVGAIRRAEVQAILETSQLSQLDLDRVWDLVGATDLRLREFACALALTARRRQGLALPKEVPPGLARQVQQLTAA